MRSLLSRPGRLAAGSALAVVATLLIALPVAAVPPGWSHPKQVFQARFGPQHSMAIDADGAVHIASEGGAAEGIWYISNAGGMGWFAIQLTHKVDMDPSIAIDPDGRVHIAFDRRDPDTLRSKGTWVITNATGTFESEKVHSGRDTDPSIAIGGDGVTHIAFRGPGHTLKYLTDSTGPWLSSTIDGTCCAGAPALHLTLPGAVRVAYPDGSKAAPTGLRVAQLGGGGWTSHLVDGHAVRHVAMDIHGSKSEIAYVRPSGLFWASGSGSSWFHIPMGNPDTGQPDIAAPANNQLIITSTTPPGDIDVTIVDFDEIFSYHLTNTKMDFDPEVELFNGGARVLFNRASGTTNDGLFYTRQLPLQ